MRVVINCQISPKTIVHDRGSMKNGKSRIYSPATGDWIVRKLLHTRHHLSTLTRKQFYCFRLLAGYLDNEWRHREPDPSTAFYAMTDIDRTIDVGKLDLATATPPSLAID